MNSWCDRSIPRHETLRKIHWPLKVTGMSGTLVAETILASAHVRAREKAGHMEASDLIRRLQNALARSGPSTYGSKRSDQKTAKCSCEERAVHIWILVVRPPRDRPIARASDPLFYLPHVDAPGQW